MSPAASSIEKSPEVRIAVLEVRTDNLECNLKEQKKHLEQMNEATDKIEKHIAKQNGTLPRIEESLQKVVEKTQAQEVRYIKSSVKTNIMWIALSSIVTGGIMMLLKYVFAQSTGG